MATAKAGPRRTSRKVTLSLTEGEADLLLGVLAQVSGSTTKSPRKYARRISSALEGALGYGHTDTDSFGLSMGNIEFSDYGSAPITGLDRVMNYLVNEYADEYGVLYA
jgi:hypothetical protein